MFKAFIFLLCAHQIASFRIYQPRTSPSQNITYSPFEPYEQGFVGYFGDSTNYQRERVNEGSPDSASHSIQTEDVNARQVCPSMVGPFGGGRYYCKGREYGYCDRRSGTCFCNMGYQGVDCGECTNTHFKVGSLCYPKKLCPDDCSGHGNCNYTIGECVCEGGYWGEDCSKVNCRRFDELCVRCSNTTCTTCAEGFSVQKKENGTRCMSCSRFDPRCSSCNDEECLGCADPLLSSARRSGYRHLDAPLTWDEQTRDLTIDLPFGSQSGLAFADSEPFSVVASASSLLRDKAVVCHQGLGRYGGANDASWTCNATEITHKVCGHPGTVSFASPTYTVSEGNGFIAVTVVRTGGGYGAFEVKYALTHISTDDSDVSETAPYTTSTLLPFFEGSVAVTFKIMVHDDRLFEGDEQFLLSLQPPTGASSSLSLGAQSSCVITVIDNDQPLTDHQNSKVFGDFDCVAGNWCNFTITAYSSVGLYQLTGGDLWLAMITNYNDERRSVVKKGFVNDLGNGTYSGHWMTETQGRYALRVYLAVGGFESSLLEDGGVRRHRYSPTGNGGLVGTYFNSPFLESGTEVMQRVDAYINFTWGLGPLTKTASDFVTVRWEGALMTLSENQEEVEISVICDDGVRVWIDHRLLIDEWHTEGDSRNSSAIITMNPFELYHIVIEYREVAQDAYISLWWKFSGMSHSEIIPQSALYHIYEVSDTRQLEESKDIRGGYKGRGSWNKPSRAMRGTQVTVVSAETNHQLSDCVGNGLFSGIAGQEHKFVIRPRDRFGNLRNDESLQALRNDPFQSTAVLEDGDGGYGITSVPVTLTYDNINHEFKATYTPTISGKYSLHVQHAYANDTHSDFGHTLLPIFGSPFTVMTSPAITFARKCNIWALDDFNDWHVGDVHKLKIRSRDSFGNLRQVGGDGFQVVAYSNRAGVSIHQNVDNLGDEIHFDGEKELGESLFGSIVDHGDGDYTVTLRPIKKGSYTLAVYLNGQHVDRSPYDAYCKVGVAHAGSSVAIGRGLYTARATFTSAFTFQARDKFSNDLEDNFGGKDNTRWNLTGYISAPASDVELSVTQLNNGSAFAFYTPKVAGDVLLSVFLQSGSGNKEHISGSPFKVHVADGPLTGSTSAAIGRGVRFGVAGEITEFTVQARDMNGNLRSDDGNNGVVYTDGRLEYQRKEQDEDQGEDDVFNVSIVLTTPFFEVHTPSFRGVLYSGPTSFDGNSQYMGNGIHRVSYNATASGVYNVSVRAVSSSKVVDASSGFVDGEHIIGSPFSTYIAPSSVSAELSLIWGHGLKNQVAGLNQRVYYQAVDLFGNNRTNGGDIIRAHVALNKCSFNGSSGFAFDVPLRAPTSAYRPSVVDEGHGRYAASYVPLVSGKYTVRSTIFQRGGLDATYFGTSDFTRPLETREDGEINFDWGLYQYNSPTNKLPDNLIRVPTESTTATTTVLIPPVDRNHDNHWHAVNTTKVESSDTGTAPTDHWSVRWSGYLLAPAWNEEFTLYVDIANSDDSVAIFLDGRAIIGGDAWDAEAGQHTSIYPPTETESTKPRSIELNFSNFDTPPTFESRIGVEGYELDQANAIKLRRHAEGRSYEEMRYAFTNEMVPLSTSELFNNESGVEFAQVWATQPEDETVSVASKRALTVSGLSHLSNSFFFPRPNEPHALEVVYRHSTGNASIQLSWSSPSMQRNVIPSSYFLRPLPLSGRSYDLYVRPAPTHPASSTALGNGLRSSVAGLEAHFMVEARDQFGNLRLTGGDVVSAVGVGPGVASFAADVFDLGDGRYNVSYYALAAGNYSLSVTVGSAGLHNDFGFFNTEESVASAHVIGSPFQLHVNPGNTFGPSCIAFGDATQRADVGVGVSGRGSSNEDGSFRSASGSSFVIVSKDLHHNMRKLGGDMFDVKLVPVSGKVKGGVDISSAVYGVVKETVSRVEVGTVTDNKDGTYLVSYSSLKSGDFHLSVRLKPSNDLGLEVTYYDNNMFTGEPLEIHPRFQDGQVSEYLQATKSRIEDPPQFGSFIDVYSENFAHVYDQNSQLLGGGDDIRRAAPLYGVAKSARWSGYLSVPITESYVFTLKSSKNLGVGGRIWVNGILLVSVSSFTGIENEERISMPLELELGVLHSLLIEVFDVSDKLEVWWESDRTPLQQIPRFYFHPPNAITDASKSEEKAEELNLIALRQQALLGDHISGSPFPVYIAPAAPFPPNCVALGLGRSFVDSAPSSLYGYANQTVSIELRSHDVFGNLLDKGGADWFIRIIFNGPYSSSPDSFQFAQITKYFPRDNLNGTYTIDFTPELEESTRVSSQKVFEYTLQVMLATSAASMVFGYGAEETGSSRDGDLLKYYTQYDSSFGDGLSQVGGGLKASYFANPTLTEPPQVVRIDSTVNVQFPSLHLFGSVPNDSWPLKKIQDVSARWSGFLKAPHSGTFSIILDLGKGGDSTSTSLFLDDVAVVFEESTSEWSTYRIVDVVLEKGVLYKLLLETSVVAIGEIDISTKCRLEWLSDRIPQQIIPSHLLFPGAAHIDQSPLHLRIYS